jgi:hypothetical protein
MTRFNDFNSPAEYLSYLRSKLSAARNYTNKSLAHYYATEILCYLSEHPELPAD